MDYVAAYQMLTRSAPVRPGDAVLVQGAGGGVGTAFMQFARLMGVRVLGSDREAKRSHVESHGGVLIDFEREDVVERCFELTDGRGVDFAFDGVGATAGDSVRAVRIGGRLVCFGMMGFVSGTDRDLRGAARTIGVVASAPTENIRPGGKRVSRYSIQKSARQHPDLYRRHLAEMFVLCRDQKINPCIAASWKLREVPAAVEALARGSLPGKQVVTVAAA